MNRLQRDGMIAATITTLLIGAQAVKTALPKLYVARECSVEVGLEPMESKFQLPDPKPIVVNGHVHFGVLPPRMVRPVYETRTTYVPLADVLAEYFTR